jgi:hypothetical protein
LVQAAVGASFDGNVGAVLQVLMLQPLVGGAMTKNTVAGVNRQRQGKREDGTCL